MSLAGRSVFHELRVVRIVQETPDARSFVLDVPPSLRELFRYEAGQFLTTASLVIHLGHSAESEPRGTHAMMYRAAGLDLGLGLIRVFQPSAG